MSPTAPAATYPVAAGSAPATGGGPGGVLSSGAPAPLPARRTRPGALAVLAALVLLGSGILLPRIGPNAAFVDPLVIVAMVTGGYALRRRQLTPATAGVRAVLPPLAVVAVATCLSLYSAGIQGWAVLNVAQTVYALLTFVTIYGLLWQERDWVPLFTVGLAAGIVVVTISLVATYQTGVRPAGTLYHPNYAGHFLVAAAFGVWSGMPWRRTRYAVVGLALAGVFLTASFGALLMIATATTYLTFGALRTRPWVVAYGLAFLVLLGGLGATFVQRDPAGATVGASSTLSSSRFERSSSGRIYIWSQALVAAKDHPLGVGPDGLHNRGFITRFREAHNLYVAFLAERGILGLAGLLLLGLALWRHAPPGGMARAALLAFAVANLFRETLHYRHMWLVLALLLVIDHGRRLDALAVRRAYVAARVRERVLSGGG